jgi:hypothetical protein
MEPLRISTRENELHIEGYPKAIKVIAIDGPKATRLARLALHGDDLKDARRCLEGINDTTNTVLREAAWFTAIVLFTKSFQSGSRRSQLDPKKIYGGNATALLAFNYFKALRNKHLVHDENDYAQAHPGAIVNGPTEPAKVAKIVVSTSKGHTMEEDNWRNLSLLIEDALRFVEAASDELANALTDELERESREALLRRPTLQLTAPKLETIATPRATP